MPKYVISEGKISNFVVKLMTKLMGGADLRSISPELDNLAKQDPEFKKAVEDFAASTLKFNMFMRKYRKTRNPRETEIWKTLP